MAYANHNGVRIYYRVIGQGPPLVLQHGFTQTLKRWYLCGYVEMLRRRYRLILIDPRGHGGSDKPHDPAAYELSLRVADVLAVLNDLNIQKTVFWGYSTGGRVGFGLAKHAPQRVSALIIGGHDPYARHIPPAARIDPSNPEAFLRSVMARARLDFSAMARERQAELLANDFMALAAAQQDEPSLEDILPSITMPCLLYAGELDPFCRPMLKSAESMPNAVAISLPGLDHSLAFWESKTVLQHVFPFLQDALQQHQLSWFTRTEHA